VKSWKKIWNKREIEQSDNKLLSLIRLDGFDEGAGNISPVNWVNYVNWIRERLDLDVTDSVFEVGCGGGAFLYPLYKMGHTVGGIDYATNLIKNIQKTIPDMIFSHCEAMKLDEFERFDVVFSNSVFQYFESYDYAEKVVNKMLNKAIKKISVLDINDIEKKNDSEKLRRGILSEEEYEKKYSKFNHLFYEKSFFIDLARKNDYKIDIFPQDIKNYSNNPFRFNVIISKQ